MDVSPLRQFAAGAGRFAHKTFRHLVLVSQLISSFLIWCLGFNWISKKRWIVQGWNVQGANWRRGEKSTYRVV